VIDPASLAIAKDNGTWSAYVDVNKDDLSTAPKFDYSKLEKVTRALRVGARYAEIRRAPDLCHDISSP
jgi:hypothetical protein